MAPLLPAHPPTRDPDARSMPRIGCRSESRDSVGYIAWLHTRTRNRGTEERKLSRFSASLRFALHLRYLKTETNIPFGIKAGGLYFRFSFFVISVFRFSLAHHARGLFVFSFFHYFVSSFFRFSFSFTQFVNVFSIASFFANTSFLFNCSV